jgi:hypothetical protein
MKKRTADADGYYVRDMEACLRQLVEPGFDSFAQNRGCISRGDHVLDMIQQFLEVEFEFEGEPLKILRRNFPAYTWSFLRVDWDNTSRDDEPAWTELETRLATALKKCDFFWPAWGPYRLDAWVFASRKEKSTPAIICGYRNEDWYDIMQEGDLIQSEAFTLIKQAWLRIKDS